MTILSTPKISPDSSKDDNLVILVKEFKYEPIDNKQMAKIMNFTPFQLNSIDTFWDAAKKKGKLHLGDELILTYMEKPLREDQNKQNAINHFFSRKLKNNFLLNKDYFIIDANDNLVQHYYRTFCSPKSGLQKVGSRGGANKVFYAVTNDCYVKLLMMAKTQAGEEAREYFLILQFMVTLMKKYHKLCNKRQLEIFQNEKAKLEEEKIKLEEDCKKKDKAIAGMKDFIDNTYSSAKEYIYAGFVASLLAAASLRTFVALRCSFLRLIF